MESLRDFILTTPFIILDNGCSTNVDVVDFYDETIWGTFSRSHVAKTLKELGRDYHEYCIDPDLFYGEGDWDRKGYKEKHIKYTKDGRGYWV